MQTQEFERIAFFTARLKSLCYDSSISVSQSFKLVKGKIGYNTQSNRFNHVVEN